MSNHYKATIDRLEQARLDLIKSMIELREHNEKLQAANERLKASLKRLKVEKEKVVERVWNDPDPTSINHYSIFRPRPKRASQPAP